mmetsp:Transcript_54875/g.151013  ORF Transcript_54875/g.151013 Transcript_54875/m.151013 type:complete len:216 (+) Transcript_54875:210-857(+)
MAGGHHQCSLVFCVSKKEIGFSQDKHVDYFRRATACRTEECGLVGGGLQVEQALPSVALRQQLHNVHSSVRCSKVQGSDCPRRRAQFGIGMELEKLLAGSQLPFTCGDHQRRKSVRRGHLVDFGLSFLLRLVEENVADSIIIIVLSSDDQLGPLFSQHLVLVDVHNMQGSQHRVVLRGYSKVVRVGTTLIEQILACFVLEEKLDHFCLLCLDCHD